MWWLGALAGLGISQAWVLNTSLPFFFFFLVTVKKTFWATTLPSQPTRPRFSHLLNGNHDYILDIPGCLPGFRGTGDDSCGTAPDV